MSHGMIDLGKSLWTYSCFIYKMGTLHSTLLPHKLVMMIKQNNVDEKGVYQNFRF